MVSCITASYLTAFVTLASARAVQESPDELYQHREDITMARRAADLWQPRADKGEFEAAWKLARACYWLGTHAPQADRKAQLERGIAAGQRAIKAEPDKPQGHFWTAADMGTLAQSFGLSQGIKYGGTIKRELETSIRLAPGWQNGSAESALGRFYEAAPWIAGGSDSKAETWYRKAIAIGPENRNALWSLAHLLLDHKRAEEAKPLLRRVIDAPDAPEWIPEDRELVAQATVALRKLGG
jgi:tetratricopeptide (TPR) repeat protein